MRPRGRVVEARDQVAEGRLARSRASHQGDRPRPGSRPGDPIQDVGVAGRVGETDVLEGDPPGHRLLLDLQRPRRRDHLARLGQQVEHPVEPGQVVLELRRAGGEHRDRLQEHRQVNQEHHQVAQREATVEDAHPAEEEQGPRSRRQGQVPDDLDDPRPEPGEQFLPDHQVVVAHEPGRLAPLATEGADDPHPAERLGRPGVDLLPLLADVAVERPEPTVPQPIRDRHRGRQEDGARPGGASRPRPGSPARPASWTIARQGLKSMLKTSSPTPPASSRSRLATPPALS